MGNCAFFHRKWSYFTLLKKNWWLWAHLVEEGSVSIQGTIKHNSLTLSPRSRGVLLFHRVPQQGIIRLQAHPPFWMITLLLGCLLCLKRKKLINQPKIWRSVFFCFLVCSLWACFLHRWTTWNHSMKLCPKTSVKIKKSQQSCSNWSGFSPPISFKMCCKSRWESFPHSFEGISWKFP